ncbi:hypothetical protein BgiBS90_016793 [Biomphalaria glabrata]|uniref:Uncharacterized protein n=1 Tax=Biomphalaria glabrata TaxID=6526 RepID=A0A2C9LR19_BIOGL|nr:hypothetical protein BgiBS90_016793 [Biomphalaria glabrata]
MDKATTSSQGTSRSKSKSSDFFSPRETSTGGKKAKGKKEEDNVNTAYYSEEDDCNPTTAKLKETHHKMKYKEDNVDGDPDTPIPRLERYRRELARTRRSKRKIPFIYLNTYDTVVSFLVICAIIWFIRQVHH